MKKHEIYDEFRGVVARLVGEECWAVIAGKGTGSHVSMKVGAKIPRERPLKNPTLTEDERNFDGEFVLFVTEASWRVEDAESVLCTYTDENTGERYMHLKGLAGRKVTSASVAFPSFDLHLEFEGGMHFRVFSTFANDTEEYSDYDNYIFFSFCRRIALTDARKCPRKNNRRRVMTYPFASCSAATRGKTWGAAMLAQEALP